MPDSWDDRVESLFLQALKLPDAERDEFVRLQCEGDEALLVKLQDWLKRHRLAQKKGFMGDPGPTVNFENAHEKYLNTRAGDYRLVRLLGEGGMGMVFFAERIAGDFQRTVAIKLLKRGVFSPEDLQRFRNEVGLQARVSSHRNIAALLDAGKTESGEPFLVVEYVDGQRIDAYCTDHKLSAKEKVNLFALVCNAVAFAHSQSVVHRDLKPSNILVTTDGQPKLLDFGIAREYHGESEQTQTKAAAFTPEYSSPEQVSRERLSPATDIYSLGVVLYQLIAGRPPLKADSDLATIDMVRHLDPLPLRRLLPGISRDIETICAKCLEKKPGDRYKSVIALAEDVKRYLEDRPIVARPVPIWTRVLKWSRRRPAAASLFAVVLIALFSAFLGFWSHNRSIANKNVQIQAALEDVTEQKQKAEERELSANRFRYAFYANLSQNVFSEGDISGTMSRLRTVKPGLGEPDFRSFEWYHLWRQCRSTDSAWHPTTEVRSVDVSPQGTHMAGVTASGSIWIRDLHSGIDREFGNHNGRATWLAFQQDGKTLLTATGQRSNAQNAPENELKLWDVESGTELKRWTSAATPMACYTLAPDGHTVAMAFDGNRVRLFDVETEQDTLSFVVDDSGNNDGAVSLAFSPDQRHLAVGTVNGKLLIRIIAENLEVERHYEHIGPIWSSAFSPDGRHIATGGFDKKLIVWDVDSWESTTIEAHSAPIVSVAFDQQGRLASVDSNRTIRLWDIENTVELVTLASGESSWQDICFVPGKNQLISGGREETEAQSKESRRGTVKLWNLDSLPQSDLHGHTNFVQSMALSPDNRQLATASVDRTVRVWDVASGDSLAVMEGHRNTVHAVVYMPDGKTIVSAGIVVKDSDQTTSGEICFWDAQNFEKSRETIDRPEAVTLYSLAVSHDGRWLAAGDATGKVYIRETESGMEQEWQPGAMGEEVRSLAFSPTSSLLAAGLSARGFTGGAIKFLDITTGEQRSLDKPHTSTVWSLAFNRDGTRLASGSSDRTARIWGVATGKELFTFRSSSGAVHAVGFTSDEKCLAIGNRQQVSLWDLATSEHRFSFTSSSRDIWAIAIASDGSAIAAGGEPGPIRIWRAARPEDVR